MKWKWFQRRNGAIDEIGPATGYPHRAGGYGRPAPPEEADEPPGHGSGEPPDRGAGVQRPGAARLSWNQRSGAYRG
ncbi:hypothetical protein [Micromonospora echinofusca]|uniref:Uncharacterized protein n=1 Tax=Micromonospora echinofusca TaxID=47858 RepID=A0ABS3VRY1_MICEH|nr:hypothetical protein [Micromonospora echinofusca]MBO4207123.1 hypothetical protein [Micromonospora echinofusca]